MSEEKSPSGSGREEPKKQLTGPKRSASNVPLLIMPDGWHCRISAKKRSSDSQVVMVVKIWHQNSENVSVFMEFPISKIANGIELDISELMAQAMGL